MKNYKKFAVILSLVPFTAFAASGAAAIVAKAAGKPYSESTQSEFLKSCGENVEKPICECVLKKLESKYSEDQFKNNEDRLQAGIEDKAYVQFVVDATTTCGMEYESKASLTPENPSQPAASAGAAPSAKASTQSTAPMEMSEMEMLVLMAIVDNKDFKKRFVNECVDEAKDYLGKKQAKQSCNCSYGRITKDPNVMGALLGSIDKGGNIADFEKWGYNVIAPCLPDTFTPEMEKALMDECKDEVKDGKKVCKCVVNDIKKRYTVKTLLKAAFEDEKNLELELKGVAAQCLAK
ncbi:hypothetical protein [Fibrobacter sp.]|uniref:hypothetical protein n=1 Tax=Fibrobacter sp. TaxID=35828 RepID=UPI00388EEEFC